MVSKNFARILSFISVAVLVACTQAIPTGNADLSVINGDEITVHERVKNLPSVSVVKVMHWRDDGGQGSCTGVLIARNFVLTAAHCLDGSGENKILRVAFQFTPEKVKLVRVIRYQVHEQYIYSNGTKGDLALLMLESDAPRGYAPAPLFNPSYWTKLTEKHDGYVEFYGYGCGSRPYTAESNCDHGVLRKGFTKQAVYFNDFISWKTSQGFVCGGDSGGPAFRFQEGRFYVTGIASHIGETLTPELGKELRGYYGGNKWEFYAAHPELSECTGQANYTDIARYIGWIRKNQEMLKEPRE